ncbi:cyclopropane fatty acyl phospholipid synthase [Pseudoxanthomonas winnipegensis]|jgi:cyclopropane-fatty-acyl-phospholipid synthase|uniref:Cyclopropane fatty acyl phospholipid synthase n=1 Tax=Pseudoxanthomonas winnipegensis TaxID=2480810 RepID=A0ABY1W975_9GAMM|nr:cyclopropane fatty acyl phospholipid synthase [Pseudoxanthomonas winnipegensis]TAA06748.1 cyclopropane fatty acyl phospholipid synthase [Pseudoxanthomonas winnipegensis]TAA16408.1 cyclopropane fatty acyl phospholipid synthase [Pseudoxanthomonas winnipegensis]TAH69767.1 cyclopropane fatty acyl phospholipid synthase [Pseudoxanthomonas winnipegensis]
MLTFDSGQAPVQRHDALYDKLAALLQAADVRLDGHRPWDLRLLHPDVPARVFAQGNLGLGEAYMDGHWECDRLDELFHRVLRADLPRQVRPLQLLGHHLRARLLNLQTARRAWQVGEAHYDLGNEFYAAMLDARMTYTCGYWEHAQTLDEAQEAKLDLVCRKLGLQPGMRVLDIGCGWGSFMAYAAQHYGVECVGVTISREQAAWVQQRYPDLPIEVRLQDYRDLDGRFDRIASIGMFEHVGHRNYATFMEVAARCLAPDGLFLLHTIGKTVAGATDPWTHRYIFPNGEIPTLQQIGTACEGRFVIEDVHNFGADYDRTLMAWHANFARAWPRFAEALGERFGRMWRYYLLSCAGAFRARDLQLWQLVLSARGLEGGYRRP